VPTGVLQWSSSSWILRGQGALGAKKPLWSIVGFLLAAAGLVWTLQGFDVIHGSSMSGTTTWSVIGPVVLLAGLALMSAGLRGHKR
jgi:hypothetical protein